LVEDAEKGWPGFCRIELDVVPWNTPGIRLYEPFGFAHEGRKRKATRAMNSISSGSQRRSTGQGNCNCAIGAIGVRVDFFSATITYDQLKTGTMPGGSNRVWRIPATVAQPALAG
jgi:hypothetical protein